MRAIAWAVGVAVAAATAGVARADAVGTAIETRPSAREVHAAVDAYLADAKADATLVGGAGATGYDGGFWIRGGALLLKINLTLQTRYEAFRWDDNDDEAQPGGDLSGFSLPRATLKLSGEAACNISYYAQLEFGHAAKVMPAMMDDEMMMMGYEPGMVEFMHDPGILREGWIEYTLRPELAVRAGLVQTPATRQLMVPPELQQFVDVGMAAADVGGMMPGWTDRNRDYGLAFHGALGCDGQVQYLVTVTNGDGPVHRNVLDGTTNDNLAYAARVNWDVVGHQGYSECAIGYGECEWRLAVGAWAHAYTHVVSDRPHVTASDDLNWGVDVAGGYGGFSFCAAYSGSDMDSDDPAMDTWAGCWCVQAGYLFPGTAWEIAARYAVIDMEMGTGATKMTEGATEMAFAVNYFIDGHADKLTADVSFISANDDGNIFGSVYPGYEPTGTGDGMLIRLQWQLAL